MLGALVGVRGSSAVWGELLLTQATSPQSGSHCGGQLCPPQQPVLTYMSLQTWSGGRGRRTAPRCPGGGLGELGQGGEGAGASGPWGMGSLRAASLLCCLLPSDPQWLHWDLVPELPLCEGWGGFGGSGVAEGMVPAAWGGRSPKAPYCLS